MKEYKKIKKEVEEEEVIGITCNKCGKSEKGENIDWMSNIESFNHSFGYGSNKDTETHKFELCDDCYDEFIKTFKISPEVIG